MAIVFAIENEHVPACGEPPAWTTVPRQERELRSYFENGLGEQWIASATPLRLLVTGGDIVWRTIEISNPDYTGLMSELEVGPVHNLRGTVVNWEERLWLASVLAAARGK